MVYSSGGNVEIFNGGPDGPDTTSDMTIGRYSRGFVIEDLDGDGYIDLALADRFSTKSTIYMGDENGLDATWDYELVYSATFVYSIAAGDFNGDGYKDITYLAYSSGDFKLFIFEGTSEGWSASNLHDDITLSYSYTMVMADLDNDGLDEIIVGNFESSTSDYVWSYIKGSTTWPTTLSKSYDGYYTRDIAVGIPKSGGGVRTYRGSFETNQISIPQDKKWDIVALEGTFPQNTSAFITVLDGQGRPIMGYKDLETTNVDLSDLQLANTISIRVTITSEFNWTTPVLDSLTVKWMDRRMWRDEFYGTAKVGSLLNMDVRDGALMASLPPPDMIQMVFAQFGEAAQPGTLSTSLSESISQGMSGPRMSVPKYMNAVDVADVNGDGYMDIAFARFWAGQTSYQTFSPLYLGHSAGYRNIPDHEFDTTGASDVLLEDLNGDGYTDVVFAQLRDGDFYGVQSKLFWGTANGWSSVADVTFSTTGATGVEAADIDGDGDLDLAFACYKGSSTSTDSMVFLQESAGFCGTVPDHRLPTKGAAGLAIGDVDGDGNLDLVFANSFSGGFAEIDSFVYWGKEE
ncbi:MAG: hypothetical protein GWN18_20680, partial [Thermoplasmata archaeon]|nr:VCBS repeat-containing protein [Thermoplasmata archaeon]NIS14549.1 VCBS repeat-containing protein [Thermoplasmata archaeon]NIS22381.1 VCBS repeat-containing protein [Thermoplasmata archaeon]NIT80288.1 VCBS repeat-containing protein [Thermoplasmata archaeon]NIU51395.1 VCBS repeat-containing protein [Thermoplasmata archaeon]